MKRLSHIISLLCLITCVQCTFNREDDDIILTEDLIYVSSETARFSGRILGAINAIDDHGFQLSRTEDFSNPEFISLSEKPSPGFFVGEVLGLESSTNYFFRAYMSTAGGMQFGGIQSFSTLAPDAIDYEPKITVPLGTITITAANVTSDVKVYFGDTEAQIVDIQFESNVVVRVPHIEADVRVPITVEMIEETFVLDTFEYVIGVWREDELEFPEGRLSFYDAAHAKTSTNFVVGLGFDNRLYSNLRMWELDFASWSWEEIFYPGNQSQNPFKSGSFFGGGGQPVIIFPRGPEFYQLTATGLVRVGDLPFETEGSIATEIDGDLYVYGGINQTTLGGVYKYDGVQWDLHGVQRFFRLDTVVNTDFPHFTINNESYFIAEGSVWHFDVHTLEYTEYDTAPFFNCLEAAYGVLNDKLYIGMCDGDTRDMYEYDPAKKEWKEKTKFNTGNVDYIVATFTHNERLYVLANPPVSLPTQLGRRMRLYSFSPDEF